MKTFLLPATIVAIMMIATSAPTAHAQNNSPFWSLQGNSNAATSSKLGTTNNQGLRIFTNNKLRMYIEPSGNVSIANGTSSTSGFRLYVKGGTGGVYGTGTSYGVFGNGGSYGIYGSSTNGYGGLAASTNNDGFDAYTSNGYYGIYASSTYQTGVYGYGGNIGLYGYGGNFGVSGYSSSGYGLYGNSYNGYGVWGNTTKGYAGGYFHAVNGYGLGAASDSAYYAAVFFGRVYSSVGFFTSDRNLKKNIEDVGSAMSIINKLKPKHYEFKSDAQYASLHLPTGKHFGLIAQDLEQVLPDLVHKETFHIPVTADAQVLQPKTADGKDINQYQKSASVAKTESIDVKAVNYVELIPLLIKAMQEQNQVIQQQNDKIEALSKQLTTMAGSKQTTINNAAALKMSGGYLSRITPNPANSSTSIYYHLPADASAQLLVYDVNGKLLKQYPLSNNSSGQVNMDVAALSAGQYTCSLLINGQLADTKVMQVTR